MQLEYPEMLHVAGSHIEPYTEESWESVLNSKDPRGLLLMWEPPQKNAKYILGGDPTQGITGWSRGSRTDGDHKVDNGALEVFKVDGVREPVLNERGVQEIDEVTKRPRWHYRDLQVAEFAAPCDAVEFARVANVIGRIYAGDEEDQCEFIYEAWPGPGMLTTQELLRLGYGNLWMWEYIDSVAEETNRIGWRSTRESQKILWYRARRHLMNQNAVVRSRFALDEYANAEIDLEKMRARAAYGYHDDRFMACNLCFWGGHAWTYEVERTEEPVTTKVITDFQQMAPTLDQGGSYQDWLAAATADWD